MFEKELNRYWKTVVDTIQDGVMIVDTGGTIISVNKGFESITGYKKDEIVGKPCSTLNCNSCEVARDCETCHWCLLFKKGSLKKQECVFMRKDGTYLHILKNASVLKNDKGKVTGAVETITDISDLIDKETLIETFRRELAAEDRFHGIIGASSTMQKVFDLISNAAHSDAPVIIYGESGTGKELVAKAIHETGSRKAKPYIKVNCATLNESLLESELFGHVKGSFTGAHKDRQGRFEAAGDGDIFLDEIGDLPLSTQVKLLRVLEEKVVERVGDNRPVKINTRIISATNKDLNSLVEQGALREDFYYRINVIPIFIPPLRERTGDIPLLAESFFRRIQLKSGKDIQGISKQALNFLMQYLWPGNVRELKSAFEYAFVSCKNMMISPEDLPPNITGQDKQDKPERTYTKPGYISKPDDHPQDLNEIKKRRLMDALTRSKGNKSEAARILGISRTSVWSQVKRFKIDLSET
ncbi:MAG: sigma 54-interacting transcriptional regulator [Deltaproteobacteria bacterium]|nr:sigma 54-interacting transcriptional regulator [Deltaproteobacteria bacterium]